MNNVRPRRTKTAILLVTLAICAFFMAQGASRLLGQALLPADRSMPKIANRGSALSSAKGIASFRSPKNILVRNIFDSTKGDLTLEPSADFPVGDDTYDPNQPPPMCTGSTRLVGVVFSPKRPEWSFAAITDGSGTAMLYREKMEIDSGHLLAIQPDAVLMQPSSGNRCMLSMFDQDSPTPAKRASTAATTEKDSKKNKRSRDRNGGLTDEELDQGIQKISDTKVVVQRSLVEKVLGDQANLMRTARVIPHQENGRTVGVKLYGIRRNSLLGRLGLKNGDMLRTINGFDLSDPAAALEAFATLRTKDNLSIALKDRTIDIGIQ